MVHWANAIVGYDTYPHVDQVERGLEAAEILNRMLRDDLYPHMVLARCPLLPHILSQCTERAPMAAMMEAAHRCKRTTGNTSDNVGAGTPGDGTIVLAELLRQGACGSLVLLCDSQAVRACIASGVRTRVKVCVGAKVDRHHGVPVEITGVVRSLHDGVFRNIGPMRDGVREDQGRTAVVDTGGVLVVLTERRMPMWNLEQLRTLGIEPGRLRIIVVKAA